MPKIKSLRMRNLIRLLAFWLLYPFYLIKFKSERDYIASRLKKAGLRITPKEVYKNLFLNGLDSLRFLRSKKIPVEFENLDLAQNEIGKCPAVFVSIHLGAFEMLHRGLAQISDVKVNLVVSTFRNKKLDNFLTGLRKTENLNIVRDFEVSKILKSAIRNKEIIAIMADQSKSGGETFQILGDKIPLFIKLPLTANKLGASLVFFRTFRKNDSHIIRFERVYKPDSNPDKNEIAKMLESWILEQPEQWAWNYDFL